VTGAAALYRRFADTEARGLSPMYEQWALGVADDPQLCALIDALPEHKRQVNLVFAAARHHGVPLGAWEPARAWMLREWPRLVPTILQRATQTNEAGRCATLLPALSRVEGPLALLEVGASAGLCLLPDRYAYAYTAEGTTTRLGDSPVVLPCELSNARVPERLPDVAWRAGIDLNPLDVGNPGDRDWLDALVWPEHDDRRQRLAAASALALFDPPRIERGDLVDRLIDVAVGAPAEATLVVFHTAVLVYLAPERRAEFRERVRALAERRPTLWVSNEAPGVWPDVDAALPPGLDTRGSFVLSVDGSPTALTHPHGRAYAGL
jgi:hypothetical protein